MKIGFLSCFSSWHTEPEIADYLEMEGHGVERYHYPRVDRDRFLGRRFDLVLTSLPQCSPPEFWQAVKGTGAQLVTWYFDWIQEPREVEKYLPQLTHFDLVCSTDGISSRWYEERGINRRWLQSACDTRTYKPVAGSPEFSCDVAFVGHLHRLGYPADGRLALIRRLGQEFDFRHFGDRSEVYGPAHAVLCSSAKIMVADNWRNDVPGYWSDRVYMEVGSGGFVLHPNVPGLDRHFTDGKHLVTYDGLDDLCAKARYYLEHEDERKAIAEAGWRHVHKYHSQRDRVREFLECIPDWFHIRTETAV